MDSTERISKLQSSIEDLRRTYVSVKNKLAVLDRIRKKISRKGRGGDNNQDNKGVSYVSGNSGTNSAAVEAAA